MTPAFIQMSNPYCEEL